MCKKTKVKKKKKLPEENIREKPCELGQQIFLKYDTKAQFIKEKLINKDSQILLRTCPQKTLFRVKRQVTVNIHQLHIG